MRRGGVPASTLAFFFRRMGIMVASGIAPHQALAYLSEEEDADLQRVVEQVVTRVEKGSLFSLALAEHPQIFPAYIVQLVRAGEAGGQLDLVVNRLADYLEKTDRLSKRILAALAYPAVTLVITLVVVAFLVIVVFPKEQEMFADLGGEMPLVTLFLVRVLELAFNPFVCALVALGTALAGLTWPRLGKPWYEKRGRRLLRGLVLRLPVVGPVLGKAACARVLFAMAMLLEAGLGVTQMSFLADLAEDDLTERRFLEFQKGLQAGLTLEQAVRQARVFPPVVQHMFRVGQEQGHLPSLLRKAAKMYEDDLDLSLTMMAALLEPLALAVTGCIVGFVVLASSAPMLNLVQSL